MNLVGSRKDKNKSRIEKLARMFVDRRRRSRRLCYSFETCKNRYFSYVFILFRNVLENKNIML